MAEVRQRAGTGRPGARWRLQPDQAVEGAPALRDPAQGAPDRQLRGRPDAFVAGDVDPRRVPMPLPNPNSVQAQREAVRAHALDTWNAAAGDQSRGRSQMIASRRRREHSQRGGGHAAYAERARQWVLDHPEDERASVKKLYAGFKTSGLFDEALSGTVAERATAGIVDGGELPRGPGRSSMRRTPRATGRSTSRSRTSRRCGAAAKASSPRPSG